MYSISVSGSKVLRLLVIDLHWKYLSRPILNGDTVHISGTKLSFTAVSVAVRLRSVSSLLIFLTSFTQLSAFLRDP